MTSEPKSLVELSAADLQGPGVIACPKTTPLSSSGSHSHARW